MLLNQTDLIIYGISLFTERSVGLITDAVIATEFIQRRQQKRLSQWPSGLRHELSFLAQTLRSWVRNALKAWFLFRLFRVRAVFCVGSKRTRPNNGL
jgi:hypothetical protein